MTKTKRDKENDRVSGTTRLLCLGLLPHSAGDLNSPSPQSGDWIPHRPGGLKNDALTENRQASNVPLANMRLPLKMLHLSTFGGGLCECSSDYIWQSGLPQMTAMWFYYCMTHEHTAQTLGRACTHLFQHSLLLKSLSE